MGSEHDPADSLVCSGLRSQVRLEQRLLRSKDGSGLWWAQLPSEIIVVVKQLLNRYTRSLETYVRSLGASEVLDYKSTNVKVWAEANETRKADVAIDCIGRKSLEDAWWFAKDRGHLISIFQPPEQMKPVDFPQKDIKPLFFVMDPIAAQLNEVTKLVDSGSFVPALDSVFPFKKFEDAFARVESGKTKGKVVLDMGVKSNKL